MRVAAIVVFIFIVSSCNNDQKEPRVVDTSDSLEQGPVTDDAGNRITKLFPRLFGFYRKNDSSFDPDQFILAAEEKGAEPAQVSRVDDSSLQPFLPLLAFNKDSSKAVDLFSYNYITTFKNGLTYAEAGEPDAQATIIDRNRKQQKRLLFLGPSYALFEAVWLNEAEIAIAGGEIINDKELKPIVWKIDLNSNITEVYHYPDTIKASAEAVLADRFQQANLRFK